MLRHLLPEGLEQISLSLEYAYNNHIQDTTKYSPFFLEYGKNPISASDILSSDESSIENNTS